MPTTNNFGTGRRYLAALAGTVIKHLATLEVVWYVCQADDIDTISPRACRVENRRMW